MKMTLDGLLVVAFSFGPPLATAAEPHGAAPKPVAPGEVDSFLGVGADGAVMCYSGKVDLGTGGDTALCQIVADELTVPLESIMLVTGDTLLTPDQGVTSGSLSIEIGGMQIRQACATARAVLVREAAKSWSVAESELTTADGMVRAKTGSRSVSFGQLVGGKHFSLAMDPKAPLLDLSRHRSVGRPVPRLNIPEGDGRITCRQDFRLPDMLHARIATTPPPDGWSRDAAAFSDQGSSASARGRDPRPVRAT
jgi:nicotinate dehydrogenase subunit B